MAKFYKVPEAVFTAITNYLMSRPYAEVAQGIKALGEVETIEDDREVKPIDSEDAK